MLAFEKAGTVGSNALYEDISGLERRVIFAIFVQTRSNLQATVLAAQFLAKKKI